MIREEDEELLRKRLYTEPYEKQAGFIVKKKWIFNHLFERIKEKWVYKQS